MLSDTELRKKKEFELRLRINRLQQAINTPTNFDKTEELLKELTTTRQQLHGIEQERTKQSETTKGGVLLQSAPPGPVMRGMDTTGIGTTVTLKMAYVPTAIYHLLNKSEHPLITCTLKTAGQKRRVRVTSFIDGYTAHAVDTIELKANDTPPAIQQLPTMFPERIANLNELTRATLNILVEELDSTKVEIQKTESIWLLSRNSAPIEVRDPSTDTVTDLSRYLGAFVTPNAPVIMDYLRTVAKFHRDGSLYGYQEDVELQVNAIYDALKEDAKLTYVNSVINFNPEQSAETQRVRLPRESLKGAANCIDGVLLFASLLEAASLNPAIVIIPGHAFVGWQLEPEGDQWNYLETTMISTNNFKEALEIGNRKAEVFRREAEANNDPSSFRQWSVSELRSKYSITPLE